MDKLSASEALYGFVGWLTTRKEAVTMSSTDDAGKAAELIAAFCQANNLAEPREGWANNLVHPQEPAQPIVAGDGARPRCKVCGTTDHHTDVSGNIVENPPRA